jgi:DnaJ domain
MTNSAAKKDYYAVLGLTVDATMDEIKWSFRKLAHQHHPDKIGTHAQNSEVFQQILVAYQVLSDPAKRAAYHQEISVELPSDEPIIQLEQLRIHIRALQLWVKHTDPYRYDTEGYAIYFFQLIGRAKRLVHLLKLPKANRHELVAAIIPCIVLVPESGRAAACSQLSELSEGNPNLIYQVEAACKQAAYPSGWPIRQLLISLAITALLAVAFYLLLFR